MSRREGRKLRLWKILLVAAVTASAFAGIDWLRLAWARDHQPTGSAEWIWGRRMEAPTAYFLVRDFPLDRDVWWAQLQIQADEAYTAYLNGHRVGSNRYRADAPVDRYEVGRYLRRGPNRIAVQVEITRLRGGLLARIVDVDPDASDANRELVVSDDSWSVLPESPSASFSDPDVQLRPLARARTLGRSPRGRWGWLQLGPVRSLLEDHRIKGDYGDLAPAVQASRWRDRTSGWRGFGKGSRSRRLGDWVELSWDEPQVGYFGVRYADRRSPVGLVYFGTAPPNPATQAPDAVLVGVQRRGSWEDAVVRRFQYALVLGVPSLQSGHVYRVDPDRVEVWDPSSVGALGVAPPAAGSRLRSAVEDEVWSRLQGLSRRAGG